MVEGCTTGDSIKKFLHPIIDWTDVDVWTFIHKRKLKYCSLYDQGYTRLGCLFCPMASPFRRKMDRERYPKWERIFKDAFAVLFEKQDQTKNRWKNHEDFFEWWMGPSRKSCKYGELFDGLTHESEAASEGNALAKNEY